MTRRLTLEPSRRRDGAAAAALGLLYRGRGCCLLLLLVPPLLWLGIVYLGSLFALLAAELLLDRRFLRLWSTSRRSPPMRELLAPANLDIILRTVLMAAAVTVAAAIIAFPIAYYAARYARGRPKAFFYLAVMMPLWSSYLVKVYAWKLILAKEGIITWLAGKAAPRAGCSTPCSRSR